MLTGKTIRVYPLSVNPQLRIITEIKMRQPKSPKRDPKDIKDLHLFIPRQMWEVIVKQANKEVRPPILHAVLCLKRGLGLAK